MSGAARYVTRAFRVRRRLLSIPGRLTANHYESSAITWCHDVFAPFQLHFLLCGRPLKQYIESAMTLLMTHTVLFDLCSGG